MRQSDRAPEGQSGRAAERQNGGAAEGQSGGAAAVGEGVEVCKAAFGPFGGFLFLLHGVEEDVAREVIDSEEEPGVIIDGSLKGTSDVAEDLLTWACSFA